MSTIRVNIMPEINAVWFDSKALWISEEDLKNKKAIKEYISIYYTPEGFKVASISITE